MKYLTIVSSLIFFLPLSALAQGAPGNRLTGSQFLNFATNVLATANILVTLLFVIALLVFAYGIIKYLLAAGDASEIQQARGYILWGVIGMAVLASLFGLIMFLQTVFGVNNAPGNLQAPATTGSTITQGTVNGAGGGVGAGGVGGVGGVGGAAGGVIGGATGAIAPPPPPPPGP